MSRETKKYGIITTINFDNAESGAMQFTPAKSEFLTQFDKILQDMQVITSEVVRIIGHPNF